MIGRRGAIGGLVTSWWAAGNARTPQGPQAREAGRPDRRPLGLTRAGVGPAPASGTFIGRLIVLTSSAPGTGLFVYNGPPAKGNLIAQITGASGTDGHGDTVGPIARFGKWSASTGAVLQSFAIDGTGAVLWTDYTGAQVRKIILPSGDTTGVTDWNAITNAIETNGLAELLPGAGYYVNQTVSLPDESCLRGAFRSLGIPSGNYGAGSIPLTGSILLPVSPFTGTSVLQMGSAGTTQHGGQVIENITISGSVFPAGNNIHGIESIGYVAAVTLRDVLVWGGYNTVSTTGMGGNGLYAHNDGTAGHNPDFWDVDHCKFSACGQYGVNITALSDSWWANSEATGNAVGGWLIQNGATSRFIGCRGNNNATIPGTVGWSLVGLAGFTGKVLFRGCDASANGTGVAISGTGTGTFNIDFAADNNTTQYTYAGTMHVESPAAWNVSTAAPTFA